MTKGIAVECPCCGTTSEVTAMVAHDIFGFSLAQVQHILHDFREQVPHADAMLARMQCGKDTRVVLLGLLKRVAAQFLEHPVPWSDVKAVALVSDLGLILEQFKEESKTGGSSGIPGAS